MTKTTKGTMLKFAEGTDGELLQLPLQMLMQTIFLGGNKGSGKTSAMKRLFEAAYKAGAQCGVIAPLGKWWSLRIGKNGHSKGLKVIVFGGRFGDVPVNSGSGRTIARVVVQKKLHFVLDVEMMRKDERAIFLTDFMEELIAQKKAEASPSPFVLFSDETQAIAPQKSTSKEVEKLRELMGDFARECRNYGAGLVLSAQRSANVDKDLLALCEMLVVMRTVHHLDRSVYAKWVDEKGSGADDEDGAWLRKLRRLTKGEAYVYAPEFNIFERAKVFLPDTYDATATAVLGAKVARVGKLSKLDVKKLSTELTSMVIEAGNNDPKYLRGEVARLTQLVKQHELGHFLDKHKLTIHKTHEELYKTWEKAHLDPLKKKYESLRKMNLEKLKHVVAALEKLPPEFTSLNKKLFEQSVVLRHALDVPVGIGAFLDKVKPGNEPQIFQKAPLPPNHWAKQTFSDGDLRGIPESLPPGRYTVKHNGANGATVKKNGRVRHALKENFVVTQGPSAGAKVEGSTTAFKLIGRMKDMLAALQAGPLSVDDLATVVGMAPGGGGFNNYYRDLKAVGLIGPDGALTTAGVDEALKLPRLARDLTTVVARHGSAVVGKMHDMVNVLAKNGEGTSEQIQAGVGMAVGGGGANNYIRDLKNRGIFVKEGSTYRINPVLV